MYDYHDQINFNQEVEHKKRWPSVLFLVLFGVSIAYLSLWLGIKTNTIEVNKEGNPSFWGKVANIITFTKAAPEEENDPNYVMPEEEKDRIDILVLGIRGGDDPDAENGGPYLTDTIMIFSYDKSTGKSSIVSIPRDLYIRIYKKREKINSAYAEALARKEDLDYVKKLVSQISGVYIDHAVVIDFSSFEKIIDAVGGVDIVLDRPFSEKNQWGYEFKLPAGPNHLNGQNALYYARSRYSTNDFDRARRQQQIIFALKDRVLKINFLSDPAKAFSIFNTVKNNTETDIGLWDMKGLIDLAGKLDGKTTHYIISTENLLYQTELYGTYILLPNGDNFDGIKKLFQEIVR